MATEFYAIGQLGRKAGGTTGQVEVKRSNADFDTEWRDVGAVGGGLTDDQVADLIEQQTSQFVTGTQLANTLSGYVTGLGLATELGSKADLIDGKVQSGQIGTHQHSISQVTNLQTTLNGKSDDGHTHTTADLTDVTDFAAGILTADDQEDARGAIGAMADDAILPRAQVQGLEDELAKRPVVVEVASLAAYNALPAKTPGVIYIYPEA